MFFVNSRNKKAMTNFWGRLWLCVLNNFTVKHIFTNKRIKQNSGKWIKENWLTRVLVVWFIPSDALMVKPNTIYSTHFFVVLQKVLHRSRNSHDEIIKKIVSLKVFCWNYDGVCFKESCWYQLIKNFTKNEHYARPASRVLILC